MKTLYESLLDDEDILVNNADKVIFNDWKQNTIEFIKENYSLYNLRYRKLKIELYLKLNPSTRTVDIKQKNVLQTNHLTNNGEIPVKDFQWGTIWNMEEYGNKLKSLNNFPIRCNLLELNGSDIKDFKGIPEYINTLIVLNANNFKDLNGLENIKGLKKLDLVTNENLESLKGIHNLSKHLSIFGCKKLKELVPLNIDQLNIVGCPLLTEKEIDKIKCERKYIS